MGSACSGAADCYELDDNPQNELNVSHQTIERDNLNKSYQQNFDATKSLDMNIRMIIRIQAHIRGFLDRQQKIHAPVTSRKSSKRKYFNENDELETLEKRKISIDSLRKGKTILV